MALIDRDITLEHMKSMAGCATCNNYNYVRCRACIWDDATNIVDEMPAVDAVPVVHGRWGENGDCSECGFQPWYERDIHTLLYCPNCGAKMDGERREAKA